MVRAQKVDWGVARRALRLAINGQIARLGYEFRRGDLQCYQIANITIAARVSGSVFHVVAAAGQRLNDAVQEIIRLAKSQGCNVIQYETKNPKWLKNGLLYHANYRDKNGLHVYLFYLKGYANE